MRTKGFTLLELLVTVALVGVIVGLAVPSFRGLIQSSRSTSLANELSVSMNYARSEAVRRGLGVTVCPSNDETDCGGEWTDGWIVLLTAGGAPLQVRDVALGANTVVRPDSGVHEAIDFGALGELASGATALDVGVLGCRGERARRISISPGGRVSVELLDCDAL